MHEVLIIDYTFQRDTDTVSVEYLRGGYDIPVPVIESLWRAGYSLVPIGPGLPAAVAPCRPAGWAMQPLVQPVVARSGRHVRTIRYDPSVG